MTTRRRATVRPGSVMTLAFVLGGAMLAAAQLPKEPDWRILNVGGWLAAAKAHVPGKADEPALAVAAWSDSGTRSTVERAIKDKAAPDVLAKGLVLHTDIAIMERMSRDAGPTLGATSWVFLDGKSVGLASRSIHWDIARRIASALAARPSPGVATSVEERPPGEKIARAWVRTVVALEHEWAELSLTRSPLGLGALLFPDDPVLALYEGTFHQAFADPRVQQFIFSERSGMFNVRSAGVELEMAEAGFRRALAIDSTLVEARIRLAHVAGIRGRPEESVALAREALAGPLPPFLEFYAAMVLGRGEVAVGRAPEARAAFERAAARYPKAQSPRVALTHVALIDGRTADGVDTALQALGPRWREEIMDPWDWYFRLHEPSAQAQLAALRASVQ
jgi:hypothetical protein